MAKLTRQQQNLGGPARRPGQYYLARGNGGLLAKKWPRKRGRAATPAQLYKETEFGTAARWASSPDPGQLESAIVASKGVNNVPRDFLTASAFGTHTQFYFEDGTEWTRYRDVTVNAQLVLDQVTDDPLSIVWRSQGGWIGATPNAAGQVLTYNGGEVLWQNVIPPPSPFDAGAGVPTLPYFADANMYLATPTVGGAALGTLVTTANRIYFVPLIVPYNRLMTSIAIRVPTGGAIGSSSVRLGVFLLDTVNGGPGTVALDAGTVSTATTGLKSIAINQQFARGIYFAAMWTSHAITVSAGNAAFSAANCGIALGAASPAPCNWLIRTETFGSAFSDQTSNTQTTNTGTSSVPIIGLR